MTTPTTVEQVESIPTETDYADLTEALDDSIQSYLRACRVKAQEVFATLPSTTAYGALRDPDQWRDIAGVFDRASSIEPPRDGVNGDIIVSDVEQATIGCLWLLADVEFDVSKAAFAELRKHPYAVKWQRRLYGS